MGLADRKLWQIIIQEVVAKGGNIIRPWFTQLEPISLEHGLLEIQTPGEEECAYCEKHASRLFTEAAQKATGMLIGVCFLSHAPERTTEVIELDDAIEIAAVENGRAGNSSNPINKDRINISKEYTFGTFVAGPCNRLAHAASSAVSESPGMTYNPLFIHGASGLGKTHLLQATCNKILEDNPDRKSVV